MDANSYQSGYNPRWPSCLAGVEELVAQLKAAQVSAAPADLAALASTWALLVASTKKMDDLLQGRQPPDSQPGEYEFGPVLPVIQYDLPDSWVFKELVKILELLGMPASPITEVEWNADLVILDSTGAVASDGSLVAHSDLAVADYCWVISAVKYVLLVRGYDQRHPWVKAPGGSIPISGSPSSLTLALAGDWGSGPWDDPGKTYPAKTVLSGMLDTQPDFMVHLGDVYYAGTPSDSLLAPNEERAYFTDLWKPGSRGALALNSNHEMYSGANGLYQALGSSMFAGQAGATYFAIEIEDWLVLGLDSAYYDPSTLFMAGALVDPDQLAFIQSFSPQDKNVLVLTHHTGLSYDGAKNQPLWGQVCGALGKQPEVWYWGHIHNGIVYSPQSQAGTTLARCCGHGSLPFGAAYGLQTPGGGTIPAVSYYAHTPLPDPTVPPQTHRVLNGFATVRLEKGKIVERFYEQGNPSPAWELTTSF